MSRRSAAFTLIELMVVVAIIIVIITLLLPSLAKAKEEAKLVKCGANLHAIGIAMGTYNAQNQDLMVESNVITLVKPDDVAGNYAFGDRTHGWFSPPLSPLNMAWPEKLYVDGAMDVGTGNKGGRLSGRKTGDDPLNGGSWHYPITFEAVFQCPKAPEDQRNGNGVSQRGYAIAWNATSDFTPVLDGNGNVLRYRLPVKARQLTPGHIMMAEGGVTMGRDGGYSAPSTNAYGVYQRHRRNQSKGGNYLMADNSVVWSDRYANSISTVTFANDFSAANRPIAAKDGFIWAHGRAMSNY